MFVITVSPTILSRFSTFNYNFNKQRLQSQMMKLATSFVALLVLAQAARIRQEAFAQTSSEITVDQVEPKDADVAKEPKMKASRPEKEAE